MYARFIQVTDTADSEIKHYVNFNHITHFSVKKWNADFRVYARWNTGDEAGYKTGIVWSFDTYEEAKKTVEDFLITLAVSDTKR